jgi:fructose-6-phosphate aldolase 1/fructose-6-phosphate aldolase 2
MNMLPARGAARTKKGRTMEFILDTADLASVQALNETLVVDGVTTNPSIITKSGRTFEEVSQGLIEYLDVEQKLFFQVVATSAPAMLAEARHICGLRKNVYAKVPVTPTGFKVIKQLKSEGLPVLATAIYAPNQAFLAAKCGADYLAPYVNRMCNYGDGVDEVMQLLSMLEAAELPSRVVAASFKNVWQVNQLIAAGIHAVTVPVDVATNLYMSPHTTQAVEDFSGDWFNAYGRDTLLA